MSNFPVDETPFAEAVREIIGGPERLNHGTFVSRRLGFIYISVPAVANARTVGSLSLAVAERLGIDLEIKSLAQIYRRKDMIIKTPQDYGMPLFGHMLNDPSVVKFTFLRDPADRFVATYRSKFSINTKKSEARQKLFAHLGMPLEENLSMLDLAELLCEEKELGETLPQLRSQRSLTAYDLVDYDFIGRHEQWYTDYALVSAEIFGEKTRQFDPMKAFNRDPEGVSLKVLIDEETRAALAIAYRDDYNMLDEVAELYPGGFSNECQ